MNLSSGPVASGRIRRCKPWPEVPEDSPVHWERINVCSSGSPLFKQLSPMLLGPVEKDGLVANRMENLWQFSKVFPSEVDAKTGEPLPKFFTRRQLAFAMEKGKRHKIKGQKPAYCYWQGHHWSYLEARRELYLPVYVEYVQKTAAWKELYSRHKRGVGLLLLGYDGRAYTDLEKEFLNEAAPFGHELVLCAMLEGKIDLEKCRWIDDC
jgi:hypothetical protein